MPTENRRNTKINNSNAANKPGVATVSNDKDHQSNARRSKQQKDDQTRLSRKQNILPPVNHVPTENRRNTKINNSRGGNETVDLDEELGGLKAARKDIIGPNSYEKGNDKKNGAAKKGDDASTSMSLEEDLPVAVLIDDDNSMEESNNQIISNLNVAQAEEIVLKKWYQLRSTQGIFCMVVTVVTILVAVLLTLPDNNDGGGETIFSAAPSISLSPSDAPTLSHKPSSIPTDLPSASPSAVPSVSPSMAPTTARFGDATTALSGPSGITSEEALKAENSAQSQALNWVTFDDVLMVDPVVDAMQFEQRFALAVFYFSSVAVSNGGVLSSWLTGDSSECDWEGVICGNNGSIVSIALASKDLEGSIPPELFLLPSLTNLDLKNNSFEAMANELPGTSRSSALQSLYLSDNSIFQEFPNNVFLRMPDLSTCV